MAPRRCDRNTSALPQCGQCRLGPTFIPNAPYYTYLGYRLGATDRRRMGRLAAGVWLDPNIINETVVL